MTEQEFRRLAVDARVVDVRYPGVIGTVRGRTPDGVVIFWRTLHATAPVTDARHYRLAEL